ncbi:hypothetical protein CCP3SC15_200024 [Gammaproteobacteria bacterium]
MVDDSNNKPVEMLLRLRDAQGRTREERIGPERTEVVVGRYVPGEQAAQLTVEDNRVSRRHCKLFWSALRGGWLVQDLGASNGTRLNGELLTEITPLHSGDTLLLGLTLMTVRIEGEETSTEEGRDGEADRTMMFDRASQSVGAQESDFGLDATQVFDARQTHTIRVLPTSENTVQATTSPPPEGAGDGTHLVDTQWIRTFGDGVGADGADKTSMLRRPPSLVPQPSGGEGDATQLANEPSVHPFGRKTGVDVDAETMVAPHGREDATLVVERTSAVGGTNVMDAPAVEIGPDAKLQVALAYSAGGVEVLFVQGKGEYLIGRASSGKGSQADISVADDHASRRHCRIYWREGRGWMVEDLGSANGTQLNGEDLTTPMPVRIGSELLIGTTRLRLKFIVSEVAAVDTHTRLHDLLDQAKRSSKQATSDSEATLVAASSATVVADPSAAAIGHTAHRTVSEKTQGLSFGELLGKGTSQQKAEDTTALDAAELTVQSTSSTQSALVTGGGVVNSFAVSQSLPGLAEELIEANFLTREQATSLVTQAQVNGQTFFRVLAEDGSLKFQEKIFKKVSEKLGIPLVETEKELMSQLQRPEPDWLPAARAHRFGTLALSEETEGEVRIATIDPFDLVIRDIIERFVGRPLRWTLVYPEAFFQIVRRLRNSRDALGEDDGGIGVIDLTEEEEARIRENVTGVDVPKMVDYFLHRASSQGASDIHIEPAEDFMGVRNRIDGILHEEITLPQHLHSEVVSRIKIMSGMDVAEKRRPQDGRFGRIIRGNPIDVRVSTFPTVYGEKVVFRLLDKNALQPSPESLGLLARDLRLLRDKLSAPYGLIMISGPTGSGKTTTLYSCLSAIDKTSKNVLTVEDPVEYRLGGVHQMQVNSKIGLTFASGLRTILRQDPDVIMVGECRDAETAGMAIQAALTGHVVFSTIHTNDAVGVIPRLLDMKIESFLVATALTLAIAQRLVRRICPYCKTAVMGNHILDELKEEGISRERLRQLGIEIDPEMEYAQGRGCERCRRTGYLGRRAVFEVFEMTNEARSVIMGSGNNQGKGGDYKSTFSADELRKHVLDAGMTTLIRHGLKLVEDEVTTFQEVIRVLGETT